MEAKVYVLFEKELCKLQKVLEDLRKNICEYGHNKEDKNILQSKNFLCLFVH